MATGCHTSRSSVTCADVTSPQPAQREPVVGGGRMDSVKTEASRGVGNSSRVGGEASPDGGGLPAIGGDLSTVVRKPCAFGGWARLFAGWGGLLKSPS